jgi:sugar lactone lactonase YvrE
MNVVALLTGRGLVESPRWHSGRLYFSDWSAGEVLALTPRGPGPPWHPEDGAYSP